MTISVDDIYEKWWDAPEEAELPTQATSPPPSTRSTQQHDDGETPFEWLRRHWNWWEETGRDGWPLVGIDTDGSGILVRPGKPAVLEEKSAFAAERGVDGPLRIMSKSPDLAHLHRLATGDNPWCVTPGDYLAAVHFGGDRAAAATHIRKVLMPRPPVDPYDVDTFLFGWSHAPTPDEVAAARRPRIIVNEMRDTDLSDDVIRLLVDSNDPPWMFHHGEQATEKIGDRLEPVTPDRIHYIVDRRADLIRVKKDGDVSRTKLNADQRKIALMDLPSKLPRLHGLAPAPFMRPDGTICDVVGYDEQTGMYLLDDCGVDVPEHPTSRAVAAAVELIDEMICDFPLDQPAARAHTYSALLTPAIRHLVRTAPLHLFDGTSAGVGKNLLAESLLHVHFGEGVSTSPMPGDDDELRKQVTSQIMHGQRCILWDEAHILIGAQLARLLTSANWSDRALGANTIVDMPNLITAFALGNNVEIVGDLRRRVIKITMQTTHINPAARSGFRHPNLPAWVAENRPALLSATLTLLRAWHLAGRPGSGHDLGSFEQWADIVGGTLSVIGVDGFLDNRNEVMEESDHLEAEFAGHLDDLRSLFGVAEFTVSEVLAKYRNMMLVDMELPSGIRPDRDDAGERLGKLYRRYRNRPFPGGNRIVPGGLRQGRKRWSVAHEMTEIEKLLE